MRAACRSLPGLSDGEDLEQFLACRRRSGRTDAEVLAELKGWIGRPQLVR